MQHASALGGARSCWAVVRRRAGLWCGMKMKGCCEEAATTATARRLPLFHRNSDLQNVTVCWYGCIQPRVTITRHSRDVYRLPPAPPLKPSRALTATLAPAKALVLRAAATEALGPSLQFDVSPLFLFSWPWNVQGSGAFTRSSALQACCFHGRGWCQSRCHSPQRWHQCLQVMPSPS